jgi:hypothetical protein
VGTPLHPQWFRDELQIRSSIRQRPDLQCHNVGRSIAQGEASLPLSLTALLVGPGSIDSPIEQINKCELVIDLRVANEEGIKVPK